MLFRISVICLLLAPAFFQVGCSTTQQKPKIAGTALFPPLQYPDKKTPIEAGRFSYLWGDHDVVHGADVGLIGNIVEKDFEGTSFAVLFHTTGGKAHAVGIELSGLTNLHYGPTNVEGFEVAGLVNYAKAEQRVIGVQVASLANLGMKTKVYGFQIGAFNEADSVYGFQIGILNRTKYLYGFQIGLLNIASHNGLPFCPVINVGF